MSKLPFIAGLLLAATACTFDAPDDTQAFEVRSLAKVQLQPDSEVELLELAPGIIGITETGPKGSDPVITSDLAAMDPIELFAMLQPGLEAPPALAEAVDRRARLVATGDLQLDPRGWNKAAVEAERESPYGTATQGLESLVSSGSGADRTVFINKWCVNQEGNFGFCDVDRWGSHSRTRNDVDWYECVGATFARTATFKFRYRVWWDWTTFGYWTVNQNTWRKVWTRETGGLDYDGECKMYTKPDCAPFDLACVSEAPDAGFHLAGWGKN